MDKAEAMGHAHDALMVVASMLRDYSESNLSKGRMSEETLIAMRLDIIAEEVAALGKASHRHADPTAP